MDHIWILKAANHMDYRIRLPDICQKLVAQSLTLAGSLYKARYIHEFYGGMGDLF